jgi:nucleotide-binding universal stress UspA family protein
MIEPTEPTPGEPARIVVGISRRTGSPVALAFAVAEARLRGTSVLAVSAWRPPRPPGAPGGKPVGFPPISPASVWHDEAERLRTRLVQQLGDDAELVTFELHRGAPAPVLLNAAQGAQLLVLDSPRAGNLTTVPKTWLAPSIVLRAPCPVVIMPRERVGHRWRDRVLESAALAGRPGLRLSVPRLDAD